MTLLSYPFLKDRANFINSIRKNTACNLSHKDNINFFTNTYRCNITITNSTHCYKTEINSIQITFFIF